VIRWAPIVFFHTFAKCCVLRYYYYIGTGYVFFSSTASHDLRIFTIASIRSPDKEIPIRYFRSVFGRYFSVFTIPIPKENSVVHFGIKKGAVPPFFLKRGAMAPFLRSSTPFWKTGGRKGGKYTRKGGINTDRNTGKIPIPKKLPVTPRYNSTIDRGIRNTSR